MLMEEDMEDHKCMMLECFSYQATAKGFYDILGAESSNDQCCTTEGLALHAEEHSRALEDPSGDSVGVYAHEEHRFRSEGYNTAGASAQEHERASNLGGDGYVWMDGLLNDVAWSPPESDGAAAAAWSAGTSSLGKSLLSPLQNPHDNDAHLKNPVCYGASMHSVSSPLTLPKYGIGPGTSAVTNRQHNPVFTLHETDSRVSDGNTSDQPSVSDTLPMHAGSGSRKVKRAASQVDSAVEAQLRSRSSSSPLSVKGSVNAMVTLSKEEVVSYVQNKDLNAEMCGKVLNHGLAAMVDKVLQSHPASNPEHEDKGTWNSGETVDLKGLLVACAHAVAANDIHKAHELLQTIRQHASLFGSGEQRLAHYFAEGLVARLSSTGRQLHTAFTNTTPSAAKMLKANHLFVEVCPFVKVSHYFANKAILEAAEGASKLHIVDYGILYGLQWPCLISALADRRGGPPLLRITGIDFPRPGIKAAERVEITGRRLSEYAKIYGVPFEYHAVASKWETIQPSSLHLQDDEVLVVNSMFRLRHLLDETVLASNPRKTVLSRIRAMNPKVFVQGVKSANYNSPFFVSRFKEALTFFSYKFDMIDATISRDNQERMIIEREMMGRDIVNVVACEGLERVERPESYKQWENRTRRAGFEQKLLNQNMLKEVQVIVRAIYHKNFSVDQDGCWMLLGWEGQSLVGLSLWRPNSHK